MFGNINQCSYLCVVKEKQEASLRMKDNHIKVDWETHQILLKYRGKLSCPMAGPTSQEAFTGTKADYKGQRALKSCYSEFHRILWCGIYRGAVPE